MTGARFADREAKRSIDACVVGGSLFEDRIVGSLRVNLSARFYSVYTTKLCTAIVDSLDEQTK